VAKVKIRPITSNITAPRTLNTLHMVGERA
jgi:hypothetical protein